MTTRDDSSGATVDRFLLDAGHPDVPELRAALLSIASLAQMQVPAPGPELASMLAGPGDDLTRKRWLRQHRPAIVGLAVLAGMGLGVSGVAATSQVSGEDSGPWSVQQLTTDWTPDWTLPLAPAGSDQDGEVAWVSPPLLQLDETDPSAEGQAGDPDTQPADSGNANAQVAATAPDSRAVPSSTGSDRASEAGSGNGNAEKPDAEMSGGSNGDTAPAVQAGAPSEDASPAPEANNTEVGGQKSRNKEESSARLLDSAVDSAVDPVSSWLKKFRP